MTTKQRKIARIRAELIDPAQVLGMHPCGALNCLTPALAALAGVAPTAAVSANGYDDIPLGFIRDNPGKWILDAGAGRRPVYYENVVNFEIVPLRQHGRARHRRAAAVPIRRFRFRDLQCRTGARSRPVRLRGRTAARAQAGRRVVGRGAVPGARPSTATPVTITT